MTMQHRTKTLLTLAAAVTGSKWFLAPFVLLSVIALAAASADAATIVTDFSNFSESGNFLPPTWNVEQDFTPSGANIVISEASGAPAAFDLGQEVFLSDEFPTLATGDRVSIDITSGIAAGGATGDAGLAITSIEGLTSRVNLLGWVWNGTSVTAQSFNGAGGLTSQAFAITQPDTLFIDRTATGWSFGSILGGTETLHITDSSTVGGGAITADGSALGLWSDLRGSASPRQSRTLSNLTVGAPGGGVPEPTTFVLAALGLLGLMGIRRRRNR